MMKSKIFSREFTCIQTLFEGKFQQGLVQKFFASSLFDVNTLKIIREFLCDFQKIILTVKNMLARRVCIFSDKFFYYTCEENNVYSIKIDTLKTFSKIPLGFEILGIFNNNYNKIFAITRDELLVFSFKWELLGKIPLPSSLMHHTKVKAISDKIYAYEKTSKMMMIYDENCNLKSSFKVQGIILDFWTIFCDESNPFMSDDPDVQNVSGQLLLIIGNTKIVAFSPAGKKLGEKKIEPLVIEPGFANLQITSAPPYIFIGHTEKLEVYDKKFKFITTVNLAELFPAFVSERLSSEILYFYDRMTEKLLAQYSKNNKLHITMFPIWKIFEQIEKFIE